MNSDYRKLVDALEALGYELARSNGPHHVYKRDGHQQFVVPVTPSDNRSIKNDLARLKRRHPEAFQVRRRPAEERVPRATSGARNRTARSRAARDIALTLATADASLRVERPEKTGCDTCDWVWRSDLPASGRPCPVLGCGGTIIVGKDRL